MKFLRVAPYLALISLFFGSCSQGDASLGEPCTNKADCASGLCLLEEMYGERTGWTGGYCSQNCDESCADEGVCFEFTDGDYCTASCDSDEDCRENYVCQHLTGSCLPDCRNGWDCGDGFACNEATGLCIEGDLADDIASGNVTPGPIGFPCMLNAGCDSGVCIPPERDSGQTGWPDGYCSALCNVKVDQCPNGASCLDLTGVGYCLVDCKTGADCRIGYICQPDDRVCLPDCRTGVFDCGDQYVCTKEGYCDSSESKAESGDTPLGGGCKLNTDCESLYCIPEKATADGVTWVGGMCSSLCGECDAGFVCMPMGGVGVCLPACAPFDPSSCRAGYVCLPPAGACLPDCRLGFDCGEGFFCNPDGFCVPESAQQPPGSGGTPSGAGGMTVDVASVKE